MGRHLLIERSRKSVRRQMQDPKDPGTWATQVDPGGWSGSMNDDANADYANEEDARRRSARAFYDEPLPGPKKRQRVSRLRQKVRIRYQRNVKARQAVKQG